MRPVALCALASLATAAALAITGIGTAQAGTRAAATRHVVVRPVDAHGHAVSGWAVTRERGYRVQCDGASPVALDGGISACYPTAAYLPACWRSRHHTALCLRDARTKDLVRVRYTGAFPAPSAPDHATPIDLDLTHGQDCAIRFGGAWGQLPSHPNWVGFDSCTRGSVYGPASGDGIDRSQRRWTVKVEKSGTRDRVVTRGVRTAYLVGTAG